MSLNLSTALQTYETQGYTFGPKVLGDAALAEVHRAMDEVIAGEYETGTPPLALYSEPTRQPKSLIKIDQPHLANRTLQRAVSNRELGRFVADLLNAKFVQVWAVQLLHKPPTGQTSGQVGWHQDMQYWHTWFTPESEVFTAWLAISDVDESCGPMHFVPGSHQWYGDQLVPGGDFFAQDGDRQRDQIPVPPGETWTQVPAVMPAGAFSLHHRLTLHGSGPNLSPHPRRSFAIHLRTERSAILPGATDYYTTHLNDPIASPVIHGTR